jgi:hypothetical protein
MATHTETQQPSVAKEMAILRRQGQGVARTVVINLDGITHEESLIQPHPGGNCINWVLGHLLSIYNQVLPLLGETPATDPDTIERYKRGSQAMTNPTEARRFEELRSEWDETVKRVDAGLAGLTTEQLDQLAPPGPPLVPGDRVRDLLSVVLFHQGHHAAQTGVLGWRGGKDVDIM